MFINYSNHPIAKWSNIQLDVTRKQYGDEMIDVKFPVVSPNLCEKDISILVDTEINRILEYNPSVVMCQGEYTLAFAVVNRLKALGIICIAACSDRCVKEYIDDLGNQKKEVIYSFVKYREYR